jgi:serine/threonine-protein kinase HipA
MITTAFVNLWNKRVGAIIWDENTGTASFEYAPSFQDYNWSIAPLKMPVMGGRTYTFPELRDSSTFKGMPGLLADVLPDKFGTALINVWLSGNGRPANSMSPVELLCFIGKRGMGALEFEPVVPKVINKAAKIELESLIDITGQILSGRQNFTTNLSNDEEKALIDILKIGTSAGGARAKAIVAFNPQTGEMRSGQGDAPQGFTHWLLKFDGVTDQQLGLSSGYGKVEMAYHLMAKEAGIEMMECRLIEEHNRAHFMTRRFDRTTTNEKLHVQSFCALAHYDFNDITSYSYEQLFETMRTLHLPYTDAEQMYLRMVFNVMARNCDDHTKNFSFIMNQSGKWMLAPAFDICHAYRPGSAWVSQHSLSINGKRQNIMRDDLLSVAKKMNIKKPGAIINKVNDVISRWNYFAIQTNMNKELKEGIAKTLLLL